MSTRITHVFFDATDTLLRVHGSVGRIYADIAERHGVHVSPGPLSDAFVRSVSQLPQDVQPGRSNKQVEASERAWWRAIAAGAFEELATFEDFDAFFEELFDTFRQAAAWELMDGVRATLDALQERGVRCGIISDMDSRLLTLLQQFGIDSCFRGVYLSFRTGYCKPDARLYTTACQASDVLPENAVHIGDSWRKDVLGAREAGLNAVWFHPSGSDDAHQPWIADMRQLPALLDSRWPA